MIDIFSFFVLVAFATLIALGFRLFVIPVFGVFWGWGGYSNTRQSSRIETRQQTTLTTCTNSHNTTIVNRHLHVTVRPRPQPPRRQLPHRQVIVLSPHSAKPIVISRMPDRENTDDIPTQARGNGQLLLPAPKRRKP